MKFKNLKKLYHYTSFDTAVKIIESGVLKFSPLQRLNDINEKCRPICKNIFPNGKDRHDFEYYEKMLSEIKQISFTFDKNNHYGFDIPAMWGHYANKGDGVCFIFDRIKIIKEVENNGYEYSDVDYNSEVVKGISVEKEYNDIHDFFDDNRSAFTTKTEDWSYEQEFRVLNFIDNKDLDIRSALVGIILYNTKSSYMPLIYTSNYKMLYSVAYMNKKPIRIFEYFNIGTPVLMCEGIDWIKEGGEWEIDDSEM